MSKQPSEGIAWIADLVLDAQVHAVSRMEILKHLGERGYDVHLCAIRSKRQSISGNMRVQTCALPIRYAPLIMTCCFSTILLFLLPVYVLRKRLRFVITEPGLAVLPFLFWGPLLSSCLKLKTVLDIRSTPVETNGRLGSARAVMFSASVHIAKRVFNGITTITAHMKREVAGRFKIDPEFVAVWTDGVSTSTFDPAQYVDRGMLLREGNGLSGKFVVFYHGVWTLHRGIIETVMSMETLKTRYDDVVLFLLGKGEATPIIDELVRSKGLRGKVILHDVVGYADVPEYIEMADVGIVPLPNIPDWRYQCPLNLLEYLAMEKPVIATDIPANREILGDSECAIYVSCADPGEIAEAIAYARDKSDLVRQRGLCGRAIVKGKYDWTVIAEHLEAYLKKL